MAWTRGPRGTYSSILASKSDVNIGRKSGLLGLGGALSVLRRVGGDVQGQKEEGGDGALFLF